MNYERGQLMYEGKAKQIFEVKEHPELIIQAFKDSLTAFNGEKSGGFADKGALNRNISSLVFRYLASKGVKSHWVCDQGKIEMVSKMVEIVPLEVVVRNTAAGSLAKRLGWEEGTPLPFPIVEFYYKNDALGDPFLNQDHTLLLQVCTPKELSQMKEMGLAINENLKEFYGAADLDLIDFKIEFGRTASGDLLLADEISPDSCRLWDKKTKEKMDKDRFRRDLGKVQETYEEVYQRLSGHWEDQL